MLTIADSIALKILNENGILTGVGNELHLYTSAATKGQTKTDLFTPVIGSAQRLQDLQLNGKVHGIELGTGINADKLIVYGEKEFMLIQWTQTFNFKLLYRAHLSDWISAARFLANTQDFVLLTAHSILLRLGHLPAEAPNSSNDKWKILQRSSCTDKSTLYCSHLLGTVWRDLVVFGGNAFGELLIWQPTQSPGSTGNATLLQRIQAHNGVIFSIYFDDTCNLLTTTSDDRSIKFWHVSHGNGMWSCAKLSEVASGYGHVARVFQGKTIRCGTEVFAITVGEDSYFCVWRSNGELLYKRRHHFGAIIWNFEYDEDTTTLYTVDSTGNLLMFGLHDILANKINKSLKLPQVSAADTTEYVTKIKFLTKDLVIGVTNKNHLIYKHVNENADSTAEWHLIADFDGNKFTVLEVYKDLVVACGYKRVILLKYILESTEFVKLYDGQVLNGIIRAFQFLNADTFLACDQVGNCMLIKGTGMDVQYPIELPKCKERLLAKALMIEDGELLLLSNRQGNLMLYKFDKGTAKYDLKHTLEHPHGNLGATVLQLFDVSEEFVFLKSAGRDGSLVLMCINKQEVSLKVLSRQIVPVTWAESLVSAGGIELLLGFNDNHFVVWSREQGFAMQVPCGGGHRCWHYSIHTDTTNTQWMQLAFIKNKQVLMHKLKLFNHSDGRIILPPRNSWHVKPCNVLAIMENADLGSTTVVSGGDDNLLKISVYTHATGILEQKQEVHSHISNIKALKIVKLNANYCFIFTGGGRAQLCLTKLNLNTFQVEEVFNYTIKSANGSQRGYSLDPETRIMSLDISSLNSASEFSIYLGCSDGFIRKLFLNKSLEISLEGEIVYGKCPLQVRLIAEQYVLIAATDGKLKFYNLELNRILLNLMHHASGINSLDMRFDAGTKQLHVISGGDDQAVTYTHLSLESEDRPKVVKTLHFRALHTAQVTATCFSADGSHAFTSGVDQNLLKLDLRTEKVEKVLHSCVADIKGLSLSTKGLCFLYGCGLQVSDFDHR